MTQHHDTRISIRNPFGTMDVPAPHDGDVVAFAAAAALSGDAEDVNAAPWASEPRATDPLEGVWASRWNGGAWKWRNSSLLLETRTFGTTVG